MLYHHCFSTLLENMPLRRSKETGENECHDRNIEQREAPHKKYEKLKIGGVQAYDRTSD
jgi:hypothetical protein